MRRNRRRSVGTIATVATTVLIGSSADPAPAGQARGTLGVTVRVIANCGGTVGGAGECPADSAPLAVVTEAGPAGAAAADAPADASVEGDGGLRYVTLIY